MIDGDSPGGNAWEGWVVSPDSVVRGLLPAVPRGPLLYVGPPDGARLRWLADEGFQPELLALEPDAAAPAAASAGVAIAEPPRRDVKELAAMCYALVILDGVLSYLPPRDGDALIAAARRATRPGGVVHAVAYSVEDPACIPAGARTAGRSAAGPGRRPPVRCLRRGELAMAFEGWLLLSVTEGSVPDLRGVSRQVAMVAARRPSGGTLLA